MVTLFTCSLRLPVSDVFPCSSCTKHSPETEAAVRDAEGSVPSTCGGIKGLLLYLVFHHGTEHVSVCLPPNYLPQILVVVGVSVCAASLFVTYGAGDLEKPSLCGNTWELCSTSLSVAV